LAERVLVIGGMGAIGMWVTRELVELGHTVVVLDTRSDFRFLRDIEGKFEYLAGDVTDLARLVHILRNGAITRVVHLAAILWQCEENPPLGLQVNVQGTINVLEAARITGVRRVAFTSAKAVYGQIRGVHAHPHYQPVPEDAPKNPDSIYGATKLAAEHFGLHYARKFGVDFVALRLATLYGPGRLARHGAVAMMSEMLERARNGLGMQITKGTEQGDDLLYTPDVASGIVRAVFAKGPGLQHRFRARDDARPVRRGGSRGISRSEDRGWSGARLLGHGKAVLLRARRWSGAQSARLHPEVLAGGRHPGLRRDT